MAVAKPISGVRFAVLVGMTAVLFFLSLVPTEVIPEIPVDIDFKPYFVPLALVALLPLGRPTLAVALGVALGEGLRDLMEGYEVDDPIGFFGYFLGFVAGGYAMGARPLNASVISIGAVVCAAVQGFIEASAFLLFGDQSLPVALSTAIGNTITHGVVMGAIPAVLLIRALHGRFERYLGFAPKGTAPPRQSLADMLAADRGSPGAQSGERSSGLVTIHALAFRYPGREQPALRGVDLSIGAGEVLGLLGPSGAGKSTLCLCLAGIAPRDTGGEIAGRIAVGDFDPQSGASPACHVALVTENAAAQLTQVHPLDEVASVLMNRGEPREKARTAAAAWLDRVGLPSELRNRHVWELAEGEQRLVALAAALAADPQLLIFDDTAEGLDEDGRERFRRIVCGDGSARAVLIVDSDLDRLLEWADRVAVLAEGRVLRAGPSAEVLGDAALLKRIGFRMPVRLELARNVGAPGEDIAGLRRVVGDKAPSIAPARPQERTSGEEPVLAISDVSFRYANGPEAVRGVSLQVHSGELVAIAGPHGAGKSTLAKLIVGLEPPRSGRITLCGHDAADLTLAQRLDLVGMALRDPDQCLSERTVLDEIAFPLRNARIGAEERRRRAAEAAELVGLPGELFDSDPTSLSLGQRKLVTIATALVRSPKLVILDEPMDGLDGVGRENLLALMRRLAERGVAVIVLDHHLDLIAEAVDRTVLMREGAIVADGRPEDLFGEAGRRWQDAGVPLPRAARLAHALGLSAVRRADLVAQAGG